MRCSAKIRSITARGFRAVRLQGCGLSTGSLVATVRVKPEAVAERDENRWFDARSGYRSPTMR